MESPTELYSFSCPMPGPGGGNILLHICTPLNSHSTVHMKLFLNNELTLLLSSATAGNVRQAEGGNK